ncbi:uncharacterized protein [Apostichopus japonicus]|uniref:uncharacterized protein isoform X2 n=1 Tax=Stichopus japonicus TaxID=307972 RepID=UPI003AB298CE
MILWCQIALLSLFTIAKGERRFDRECNYGNTSTSSQHVNCICSRNSSICLICNVSKSSHNLTWYNDITNLILARQSFKKTNTESFEVDRCNSSNYSILLLTPCSKVNQANYSCLQGETKLMTFILTLQVTPIVIINGTNFIRGNSLSVKSDKIITFECIVMEAILPITTTWYTTNGMETNNVTEVFNNATVAISYYTVRVTSNFKLYCSAEGPYIAKRTTSLSVTVEQTDALLQQRCARSQFGRQPHSAGSPATEESIYNVCYESSDLGYAPIPH